MCSQPVDAVNLGYVRGLLDTYLTQPETLDPAWHGFFRDAKNGTIGDHPLARRLKNPQPGLFTGNDPGVSALSEPALEERRSADDELLAGVAAAMALVKAYRMHGHLAARLDPLGSPPLGDPSLVPENLTPPLTPELQRRIPARFLRIHVPGETLADARPHLRATYCGTVAYEIEHIASHEQRVWLRREAELGAHRAPLSAGRKRWLLGRLCAAEGFERYLRRAFLSQKQFSLEGLDVLVPMLDELIELAAGRGAARVIIGMAHRGRLNVLAHTLGQPYGSLVREFEGERTLGAVCLEAEERTGDVKYHLGARAVRHTEAGEIEVQLAANPSHLEAVDPVVEGSARAAQTDQSTGEHNPALALPVLIHGDAAFPSQGVVAETLNLQGLDGYSTGGTVHLIANNQIGFTTDPGEARSTRNSSDLAKGFDVPIIHVNADDPEAGIGAVRLALAFRERFHHDVVVDVVGYRRWGHNEQDEPAYTQPHLYSRIALHPPVGELYARGLVEEGVVSADEADAMRSGVEGEIRAEHDALRRELAEAESPQPPAPRTPRPRTRPSIATGLPADILRSLNEQLLRVPAGFTVYPKLASQLERRRDTLDEAGGIDWGQAEALAFATLLVEGIPVRLTGQDTERGTFAHRHLVLHDAQSGASHIPIEHLDNAHAAFDVLNSPLSEYAALGFEYGYAVAVPNGLVLWEAQFGDFANNAQVIIDQFLASGFSKWGEASRLTLLLPHGYEGNGPEHSSARVERFLQLAAQGNIRIANCSTPAQYFHALRLQAHGPRPRPLVLFMPKGLLRHQRASSRLEQLVSGAFVPILDDPTLADEDRASVSRLVLCSGRVYYDIVGHPAYEAVRGLAVARLEQLYPFPVPAYMELLNTYPNLTEVVWVQEEPQNMGAWRSIRHRLEEVLPEGVRLSYTGRSMRASPSEGYMSAHQREQERFVRAVLGAAE
ncbi:MAG: 2-oxoglutarate dehydrogenase E1 component [Actinomycetia bacterium]|nr:2-oxoglutarate dehydrogenase E1 component [Actinomycetes bacterium]